MRQKFTRTDKGVTSQVVTPKKVKSPKDPLDALGFDSNEDYHYMRMTCYSMSDTFQKAKERKIAEIFGII